MKKKVLQTILLITVCLVACNSNEKAEQQEEKELEYVYIDATKILHIDKNCENVCKIPDKGTIPVDVHPVSQIYYVYYRHICASCVDEKYYDQLHINTTSNLIKYYTNMPKKHIVIIMS